MDASTRPGTLGELAAKRWRIWIECGTCGRTRGEDAYSLATDHGFDLAVTKFRRRLRCEGCGARGTDIFIYPAEQGVPFADARRVIDKIED